MILQRAPTNGWVGRGIVVGLLFCFWINPVLANEGVVFADTGDPNRESIVTPYEPVVIYGERIGKPLCYRKWAIPLMGLLFGIIQLWVYYDQDDDAATGALKVTGPPP